MEEQRKPTRWGLWIAAALALLVAYPLGIGPINWCDKRGLTPIWVGNALNVIYTPLGWIAPPDSPAGEWLVWYSKRWR